MPKLFNGSTSESEKHNAVAWNGVPLLNIQRYLEGTLFTLGLLMGWGGEAVLINYKDLFRDIVLFYFNII